MSRRTALGLVLAALATLAPLVPSAPVGAQTPSPPPFDAAAAVSFLKANQQPDGGFETAGFPGFETPDAVLAIAESAQAGSSWSTTAARAAVAATVRDGRTPLDYLDDLAEATTSPGQAAKLIVLAVAPLGFDAAAFDPQGDGAADLVARMDGGANADGSFGPPGALNATLYAVLASRLVGRPVPETTRAFVVSAQQANGGWNFAGDPEGTDVDVDTTGLALQALAAADVDSHDEPVRRAVALLGSSRLPSGGWEAFGAEDPNATALGILGLTAAGRDVTTCWATSVAALAARQAADGHVAGPNDSFGLNTFATSQAVQALTRRWLPVVRTPAWCDDDGYRLVSADGGVFAFGDAPFLGSTGALRLNRPVVGMAVTPSGRGYWLVASDGGVFAFGDAPFLGSIGSLAINRPVVGIATTPSGLGYRLVASDGAVFAFGTARYAGRTTTAGTVALLPSTSGGGYLLADDRGRVATFSHPRGPAGAVPLNAPVVGIAP